MLNGDGAGWVKCCEDPDTVFQLDRFHIYQKILKCIRDKKMQGRLRTLYDACKTEELMESIQIYADSIATDAVIESDKEPVILNILSASKAPKYDGKGNKTGNIMTGHILYREAEMTFSRKAFLKIFENKEFTQLVYR